MTRQEFMAAEVIKAPKCFPRHNWHLEHCENDDWDGIVCLDCGKRFTERCSFDEEMS